MLEKNHFINISNSIVQNCNLICLSSENDYPIVKIDNIEFKNVLGKFSIAKYIKKSLNLQSYIIKI